jgi:hypothetical protein
VCGGSTTCVLCGGNGQPCCSGMSCNLPYGCSGGICGGSTCGTAGVLICDGFEGSLGSNWSGNTMADGPRTIDTTMAYRGIGSLKVHINQVTSAHYVKSIIVDTISPSVNPTYVRAFVRFSSATTTQNFWLASYENANFDGITFELNGNRTVKLGSWGLSPQLDATSTVMLAADTWHCLEWRIQTRVTGSGTTSFVTARRSDADIANAGVIEVPSGAPLNFIKFGVEEQMNPTPAFDVWFDEIMIDTQPIGCAK